MSQDAVVAALAEPGFYPDRPETVASSLHQVREHLGTKLELKDENVLSFAWVTGFPLLEWRPDEERCSSCS